MSADNTAAEAVARTILYKLHRIDQPSSSELDAAMRQVEADPDGSTALALDTIPVDRVDLRLARAERRYLRPGDTGR
jgi:hypothetical protein